MADISSWSTTAANNNSSPPDGWPEGQAPSTVNDCAREMMRAVRAQWEDAEWFNYGDAVSYVSATQFKVTGDVTARYGAYRRIKMFDASTIYASVVTSSFSSPDTTVTVQVDSGTPSSSLTSVAVAILDTNNISLPVDAVKKLTYAADAGAGDTYSISLAASPATYIAGQIFSFKANTANTGASTLNVNGLGAKAIKKNVSDDTETGDILANQINTVIYDGTNMQLQSAPSGGVQQSGGAIYAGAAGGVANSYSVALSPAPSAYATGMTINFKADTANTAAANINVNSLGAKALKKEYDQDLDSSDIVANQMVTAIYDGTNFQLKNSMTPTVAKLLDANISSPSDGQLLSYDSATSKWVNSSGGAGNWVKISSQTASSSASIDFTTISSTYGAFACFFDYIVPATDGVQLLIRISESSSFVSGANTYGYASHQTNSSNSFATVSNNAATSVALSRAIIGNAAGEFVSGVLYMINPTAAGTKTNFHFDTYMLSTAGNPERSQGGGHRTSAAASDGLQFFFSSGNIASGTFTLYGLTA